MSTLTPSANVGRWVGYQILTGAGRGIVQQLVSHITRSDITKAQRLIHYAANWGSPGCSYWR